MGFFNKEIELTIPNKNRDANNKTTKGKSLNGYGAIRENIDSENTRSVKQPVVNERTKPKVSWFAIEVNIFILLLYIYIY